MKDAAALEEAADDDGAQSGHCCEELFIAFFLHTLLSVGQRNITAQMEVSDKAFSFLLAITFRDHNLTCTS